jgi:peptide subunit release factor 1 (eRF1)
MTSQQSLLPRSRMPHLLAEIGKGPVDFTLYIKSGSSKTEVEKELARKLDRGEMLDELVEKSVQSPVGAVIFYGQGKAYIVQPPFPLQEDDLLTGYDPEPLQQMLKRNLLLGLVLVRLGHYAVGVFKGDKLVEGKAGTGLVHARHHKGGSSANRFARHREKQMEYFFTRVELHSREILEKYIKDMDYVVYGGTRDTLQKMWKQCDFFKRLQGKTLDRLIAVREPKRSTFDDAVAEAYASKIWAIAE